MRVVPLASARLQARPSLAPALKHSLEILRLPGPELDRYLERAVSENLFLSFDSESIKKREYFHESRAMRGPTLRESLFAQLRLTDFPRGDFRIAEQIIGSLDEAGYLDARLEDIASACGMSLARVERALRVIQSLEPAGIAARSLGECLALQLGERPSAARAIVERHLPELRMRRYGKIAKALKLSVSEVRAAVARIVRLDPKPGLRFSEPAVPVFPEVAIRYAAGRLRVFHNESRLRLNAEYRGFLRDATGDPSLKEKWKEGVALVNAVTRREKTVGRVARYLVRHQAGFFGKGAAHLRPLTLEKVARALGLHKSTVCRAVKGKYVETPHGVLEFRIFFSPGHPEGISKIAVQNRMLEMLRKEPHLRPLTDGGIAALLRRTGIEVSRRTIAKYRLQLHILPARLR